MGPAWRAARVQHSGSCKTPGPGRPAATHAETADMRGEDGASDRADRSSYSAWDDSSAHDDDHHRVRCVAGRARGCGLRSGPHSLLGPAAGPAFRASADPGGTPMTATAPSTALVTIQPAFTESERLALAGFLAGYRGLTREAYTLDLRQFTAWCRARSLALFAVRRADIETFARELEARGRARATVTRRLCTIAGLYRYAVEEELLDHSPAAHVRRPRLDYESHATALDRNELGALLVAAGLGPPPEHALISLFALIGLRVSEATGADIEQRVCES